MSRKIDAYPSRMIAPPALQSAEQQWYVVQAYLALKDGISELRRRWRGVQPAMLLPNLPESILTDYGTIVFDEANTPDYKHLCVIFKQIHLTKHAMHVLMKDLEGLESFLRHHNEIRGAEWSVDHALKGNVHLLHEATVQKSEWTDPWREKMLHIAQFEKNVIFPHWTIEGLSAHIAEQMAQSLARSMDEFHALLDYVNGGSRQTASFIEQGRENQVSGCVPPGYLRTPTGAALADIDRRVAEIKSMRDDDPRKTIRRIQLEGEYAGLLRRDSKIRHTHIAKTIQSALAQVSDPTAVLLSIGGGHSVTDKGVAEFLGEDLSKTALEPVILRAVRELRLVTVETHTHSKLREKSDAAIG